MVQHLGWFFLLFGILTLVVETVLYALRVAKWDDLRTTSGGKRYTVTGSKSDWVGKLGKQTISMIPVPKQSQLGQVLIRSGMDPEGRIEKFLGLVVVFLILGILCSSLTLWISILLKSKFVLAFGIMLAVTLFFLPWLTVFLNLTKRREGILKEIPDLILAIRRELSRDANFIEAFARVEKELSGELKHEIRLLNSYVASTKGDVRSAVARLQFRCGHRAVDLFCMTILQGMDTDRVIDGLKELDLQISGILRDRIQKQTEKRNLMVFFGTLMATSILLLQGAFYGFLKLKEQLTNLPFS